MARKDSEHQKDGMSRLFRGKAIIEGTAEASWLGLAGFALLT